MYVPGSRGLRVFSGVKEGYGKNRWNVVLRPELLDQQIEFLEKHPRQNVRFVITRIDDCYNWEDFDFSSLKKFSHSFSLVSKIDNYARFESFDWLEELSFGDFALKFNVTKLRRLRSLYFNASQHKISGLELLSDLRSLTIFGRMKGFSANSNLSFLAQFPMLLDLGLIRPKTETLDGLHHCPNLKWLDVSYAPKLRDISSLDKMSNLESLWLQNCKQLLDWHGLADLRKLKRLDLWACGDIPSLDFVSDMPCLESLVFPNTKVLDGRVKFLKEKENLKSVGFSNARHYDAKVEEMRM